MDEVVYYKDKDLEKRWRCSGMKLWRLRRDGKLNSIQIGGCGPYLTSEAEIARIEAPPDIAKARPLCGAEGSGRKSQAGKPENSTDKRIEPIPQAFPNGRVG